MMTEIKKILFFTFSLPPCIHKECATNCSHKTDYLDPGYFAATGICVARVLVVLSKKILYYCTCTIKSTYILNFKSVGLTRTKK